MVGWRGDSASDLRLHLAEMKRGAYPLSPIPHWHILGGRANQHLVSLV